MKVFRNRLSFDSLGTEKSVAEGILQYCKSLQQVHDLIHFDTQTVFNELPNRRQTLRGHLLASFDLRENFSPTSERPMFLNSFHKLGTAEAMYTELPNTENTLQQTKVLTSCKKRIESTVQRQGAFQCGIRLIIIIMLANLLRSFGDSKCFTS